MGGYNYKPAGIQFIDKIPSHWKIVKIKRVLNAPLMYGANESAELDDPELPRYIRITDFGNDGKLKDDTFKSLPIEKAKDYMLTEGDILFARSGATVGKTFQFKNYNGVACFAGYLIKATPRKWQIDSDFLYYYTKSFAYEEWKNIIFTQATIQNIGADKYQYLDLTFPPLPEQRTIADYLDKACKRIDSIIEIKQKQLERIKTIRKSKIDELVCFGNGKNKQIKETGLSYLPEINKTWNIDRFKDVARLRNEKTDEKTDENNYLELEDIDQGTGKLLSTRNTLEVESKVTKFYKGDVLFGKLRPYLEKYHYAEFDGKCTGEILAFEPFRINGKFLMYLLASKWFIDLCNSMAYGAKMPRVNWNTQLAMVYFPLPSKAEQETIVQQLDILSEKTHKLKEKLNEQITTLQTYRKSLIHECVTGKKQVWEGEIKKVN